MLGAITSERWAASDRNRWAAYVGIRNEAPIQDMAALVTALEAALSEAETAASAAGADLPAILSAPKAQRAGLIGAAAEAVMAPDERRRTFLRLSDAAVRAYKAVLPDNRAAPFFPRVAALAIVADAVRGMAGPADLSALAARIEALLQGAILGALITAPLRSGGSDGLLDLSGLDFDKLGELFAGQPRTAAEAMREAAEAKAYAMAAANPTRADLVGRLEELVAAYNAATLDAEAFLAKLKDYCASLNEEERRHAQEGLTDAELAIFDLLTRPEPKLTQAQTVVVKATARALLEKLQDLVRVRDWHQRQQPRAAVMSSIRMELNNLPEEPYPLPIWEAKVENVWQFVSMRYGTSAASAATP